MSTLYVDIRLAYGFHTFNSSSNQQNVFNSEGIILKQFRWKET
jgi:hypothetical protein